ncbi:MAG: hypothetical protein AAF449_23430 [Myxococcota bacterium]
MILIWQGLGIAALFAVLYALHRRARRNDFERFRRYHSRRKYRIVAASESDTGDQPEA